MEKEGKFKEIRAVRSFRSHHSNEENHSVNSTKFDSLNNIIFPQAKKSPHINIITTNSKERNFLQALNAIHGKSSLNSTQNFLSEFSETNANNSKEEKVLRYINNPITKNVVKDGNNLKVSFHKNFSTSINVPYKLNTIFQGLLSNIIEIEDDEEEDDGELVIVVPNDTQIETKQDMKRMAKENKHKASTAEYTAELNDSENSPQIISVNPFEMDKNENGNENDDINDLDEIKEVVLNDYKNTKPKKSEGMTKGKTKTLMKESQLKTHTHIGDMLIVDSLMSSTNVNYNNSNQHQMNRRLFTQQCNIDELSNSSHREFMRMIKLKTTDKKIPQKYYRRELVDSIITTRSNKTSNHDINTNLIDKFNKCEDDDDDDRAEVNDDANEQATPVKVIGQEEEEDIDRRYQDEHVDTSHGYHLSNNISINAEMVDFITDNELDDNNDELETDMLDQPITKAYHKGNKGYVFFNNLTPIRHLDFDKNSSPHSKPRQPYHHQHQQLKQNFQYKTPTDRRKKFKVFKPSTKPTTTSSPIVVLSHNEDEEEAQTVYDIDFINNLLARDSHGKSSPNYIVNHPKLKWIYRSNLIDWLMEISEEFAFKRDTFHYAINYIDQYLSKVSNCEKKFLQLIGICSLSIAAKIEEVQIPKLIEYAKATDDSYTDQDIIATEKVMLKTLQWEIIPITLNTWMNWYICQWDLFLDTFNEMLNKLTEGYTEENVVYFKRPDDKSYYNYRKIAQVIDLCVLGEKSLRMNSRTIVACGILAVLIGQYDTEMVEAMILKDFNEVFYVRLMKSGKEYVEVYKEFLRQSFNFEWNGGELGKAFDYVGRFIKFGFNYDVPLVYQVTTTEVENGNYEDFISYQTYNEQNLSYLEMISK